MQTDNQRPLILIIIALFLAASVLVFFYIRNQSATPNITQTVTETDEEQRPFFNRQLRNNEEEARINHEREAATDPIPNTESEPSSSDSSATNDAAIAPGTYTATLEHDGRTRTYYVHLPNNYTTNQTYPLVFLLHGRGGSAERMLDQTNFTAKADAEGFIVVAPDGVDGNWNDGLRTDAKTNTEHIAAVDDVDLFATLIATLPQTYPIDTDRIYVTGLSNGGQMSQHLACELPNTFAAIGPVARPMREPYDRSCPNPNPTPVIGIQGTEDPFLPIQDDDGLPEMPRMLASRGIEQTPITVNEVLDFWSTVNQCSDEPVVDNQPDTAGDGTSVDVYSFNDCATGMPVEYHIVNGAGHGWPPNGGAGDMITRISGGSSENIVANDVIWEFFQQHSR